MYVSDFSISADCLGASTWGTFRPCYLVVMVDWMGWPVLKSTSRVITEAQHWFVVSHCFCRAVHDRTIVYPTLRSLLSSQSFVPNAFLLFPSSRWAQVVIHVVAGDSLLMVFCIVYFPYLPRPILDIIIPLILLFNSLRTHLIRHWHAKVFRWYPRPSILLRSSNRLLVTEITLF